MGATFRNDKLFWAIKLCFSVAFVEELPSD